MYRHRLASTLGVMLLFASTVTLLSTGGAAPAEAATSTPSCTFNGSHLPIVFGVSSGKVIDVSCTGLPPLHPYLLAEASLLAGIDPAAKAVLSGGITSLSGLLGALTALKEINMGSVALPFSDLNGDLNYNWTVPSSQPLDPNASCPPSTEEFNSGLIGCALAMIDLTSFTPVGAGSAQDNACREPGSRRAGRSESTCGSAVISDGYRSSRVGGPRPAISTRVGLYAKQPANS